MVSILFCGQKKTQAGRSWAARPTSAENDYITLLCLLNRRYDRVLEYYVAPKLGQWQYLRLRKDSPFLRETIKLNHLSDLYVTVKRMWDTRMPCGLSPPLLVGEPS